MTTLQPGTQPEPSRQKATNSERESGPSVRPGNRMAIKASNRITICGMTGTGKTTFLKNIGRSMASTGRALYVLDPLDQLEIVKNDSSIRIVPTGSETVAFGDLCARANRAGNVTIIGEEAELYVPENKEIEPRAKEVILRGRNRGIGVYLCTRRIALLNKNFFGLSDHVFIFQFFAPNDIRYLEQFIGPKAREVAALKPYHYFHFANGQVSGPFKAPAPPRERR